MKNSLANDPSKTWRAFLTSATVTLTLFCFSAMPARSADGFWTVSQLPIPNPVHPAINNSGEVVWQAGNGIFSSTRGELAGSGILPHVANSGEVLYAGWFGTGLWDLVSTTRGRLTYGGIIDVNLSDYDLNRYGEAVYVTPDANGHGQVYSTVRGQITFDAADHYDPSINDNGEIIWSEWSVESGGRVVSGTRGVLGSYAVRNLDLNNLGEFCYTWELEGPVGWYSSPHVFTSAHGVVIDNPEQFQWSPSINDEGTVVWAAPDQPGGSSWHVYQAEWTLVPEPASLWLVATGAIAVLSGRKRRGS